MTGEDSIIQEASALLKAARPDEHLMLRRAFWCAGRCESCGKVTYELEPTCLSCGAEVVDRSVLPAAEGT